MLVEERLLKENDLLKAIKNKSISQVILDVFRKEPYLNPKILKNAFLATPHIAGYSFDGKIKANRNHFITNFVSGKKNLLSGKFQKICQKKK